MSRFVVAFLPRSKGLLISWLQSPSLCSDCLAFVNWRCLPHTFYEDPMWDCVDNDFSMCSSYWSSRLPWSWGWDPGHGGVTPFQLGWAPLLCVSQNLMIMRPQAWVCSARENGVQTTVRSGPPRRAWSSGICMTVAS